jgi:glycosyltransferase involved in cell wall biosynthesis
LKILHVVASYLPAVRYGGTIVSVHGLCRALARRGHDVHVYTTSVDGPRDSAVPHNTAVDIDGVTVWYFQSQQARRLYFAPPLGTMLRDHIAEFAVVHTHAIYLWPLWTAARIAEAAGVPYVVSPRGMLEKELIEGRSLIWKAALIGFFEKRTLERAAAIHFTSRREAGEARAFGFDLPAACEIPNGVDIDTERAAEPSPAIQAITSRGPYTLFLGRINWKKGLDRLIRSLVDAPRVRLVLAGNDDEGYRQILESLAQSLGVSERVIFAGPVAGADKSALLQRAEMLVLPSYSENFGNVVLEAMAAGRPVVVTPEVGVAEMVREGGVGLVAGDDATSLGRTMARLTDDPALGNTLGARGQALAAEQFTWDAVAARMEALYERVASGRRPRC